MITQQKITINIYDAKWQTYPMKLSLQEKGTLLYIIDN